MIDSQTQSSALSSVLFSVLLPILKITGQNALLETVLLDCNQEFAVLYLFGKRNGALIKYFLQLAGLCSGNTEEVTGFGRKFR